MEGMHRPEADLILPISDNRVQIEVAEYAFDVEHPGTAASRNEKMKAWIENHAADWRTVVEAHGDEKVSLKDAETIARFYAEMLRRHDETDATMH